MPYRFEQDRSQSPFIGSISELMQAPAQAQARAAEQAGNAQANAALARGNAWAGAAQNIGQAIGAIPQQIQQAKAFEQRQQFQNAQMAAMAAQQKERELAAARAEAAQKGIATVDQLMATAMKEDPATGVKSFDRQTFEQGLATSGHGHLYPQYAEMLDKLDLSASKRNTEGRQMLAQTLYGIAQHGYTPDAVFSGAAYLKANSVITDKVLGPVLGAIGVNPSPENIKATLEKISAGLPEYRKLVEAEETRSADLAKKKIDTAKATAETAKIEAEVAGTLPATPAQAETNRHNLEMEKIGRLTAGRAEASASETARHNRAMEEAARNTKTNRPVTSGDAEKLADFRTALDDVDLLTKTLSGKAGTGSQSAIGAALPNVITEMTGIGASAKSRQAVIDRVKQVIGKTMEGGVLRKEDEEKYKKILPTISDPPSVAATKMTGLAKAIELKRQRALESLEDAGYNVSQFKVHSSPIEEIELVWNADHTALVPKAKQP